jgi:superfamily II DNA or RNA helicase
MGVIEELESTSGVATPFLRPESVFLPTYLITPDDTPVARSLSLLITTPINARSLAIQAIDADIASVVSRVGESDRLVLETLVGLAADSLAGSGIPANPPNGWPLDTDKFTALLPAIAATDRFWIRRTADAPPQSATIGNTPYELCLELASAQRTAFRMRAVLVDGDCRRTLESDDVVLIGDRPLVLIDNCLRPLRSFGCPLEPLLELARSGVPVTRKDATRLARMLATLPAPPRLDLPQPWTLTPVQQPPTGQLHLSFAGEAVTGDLSFDYGGSVAPSLRPGDTFVDSQRAAQVFRDRSAEGALRRELAEFGRLADDRLECNPERIADLVYALTDRGWTIFADGRTLRRPGAANLGVSSGIDWFDLDGGVTYDGAVAQLPELLKAARSGRGVVRLDDGSLGILPREWLERHASLLALAEVDGEKVRFRSSQAALLDELLDGAQDVRLDERFRDIRQRIRNFERIEPGDPPEGFLGNLRDYQRHGVGWIRFLGDFGWGGCLADDMGLGKTIQVLAWLAGRAATRTAGEARLPCLAIVPRSVVHHWMDESERYAPQLKVMVYHGATRFNLLGHISSHDLVVTTYHTLRNDIGDFSKMEFDAVILDEAQAVKNARSQAARAVRVLKARQRLALTGTPVENHLGDLWSLFDFLNPGMLGAVGAFRETFVNDDDPARLDRLRAAVRPFVLRRTKRDVAPELPEKTEETIYCEMTDAQQKKYNELRDFYRASVFGRVESDGLARSRMHVLEALLRLRQTACHPGLLDANLPADDSGKIEALMPMVLELIDEGHKALVFSQFTSFLSIVRTLLDREGVTYEYLDGKTRDRQARIDRFQKDDACKLFLISLKAGGVGLNLTAADYVFILDPWWNPAAEAQAIDRTHRIGQDKKVIAYRLVSGGTVEEKILELQGRKRDLAASIITESSSLMSELTREDLDVLLS